MGAKESVRSHRFRPRSWDCTPPCEATVTVAEGDRRAAAAALALARHFVVGVTDRMDDFLALSLVSLGGTVNPRRVCPLHFHERVKFSTTDALQLWPRATLAAINDTLRHEWAVYGAARRLFDERLAAADPEALAAARAAIANCTRSPCLSRSGAEPRRLGTLPNTATAKSCRALIADSARREAAAVSRAVRDPPYELALARLAAGVDVGHVPGLDDDAYDIRYKTNGHRWYLHADGRGVPDLDSAPCANVPAGGGGDGGAPAPDVIGFHFRTH